jgi:Ca-activated chloride channel family protein
MSIPKTTIMKRIIVIAALILGMVSVLSALTVTGLVKDSQGNPIPGVHVLVKGTQTGTVTDMNGTFSLNVPADATLIFNFIGYQEKQVKIKSQTALIVVLIEDVTALEEVVVTGYGVQRKSDVTGAVSSISFGERESYARAYVQPAPAQEYNTEGYSAIHENGYKNPVKEPLSTFSIDVDAASYSNVRRFILQGQPPVPDAVRIEEMINYFDYDYPQPVDGHPFSITTELGECPWNRNNLLLHIGLQGEKMKNSEIPASNLVFLIDVSGSMDQSNKLPLVKQALRLLVNQLRPQDRVAMVVYAGSSGLVLPSTAGNRKETILNALERLQAGGSTAGAAGLKLAYQVAEENFITDGNNRIILATDGDFNVGPSSNAEMERMIETYRDKGIFISLAGFGMGNYKDDKMEIIADKGNGNYSYIDNLMEAKKVFVSEFGSTLYTIAKDVKIQIEFNPAYVKEYRLVGYENRLLNEEDFENDKKDAGEMGAGHSVTALYEIVPANREGESGRQLKYQKTEVSPTAAANQELATIKFRYKLPEGTKSILMEKTIPNAHLPLRATSDNFRFSASVAGFGMILRNSEYKGTLNYSALLEMARGSRGRDDDGYRSEFIKLAELSSESLALKEED